MIKKLKTLTFQFNFNSRVQIKIKGWEKAKKQKKKRYWNRYLRKKDQSKMDLNIEEKGTTYKKITNFG